MESFFTFLAGIAIGGFLLYLITFVAINGGWETDCQKIGYHVSGSVGQKVYKCELKK